LSDATETGPRASALNGAHRRKHRVADDALSVERRQ
jgi:hypothetical protein